MLALPLVFEILEALKHGKEAEVHGTHVQRGQFRLESHDRTHTLFDGHMRATAGGDVDDGVGLRANFRQERAKKFRILRRLRSEEHTSELQSLMRISYAVFCLKKKKNAPHTAEVD